MSSETGNWKVVGKPVRKIDGIPLATGSTKYVADDLPVGTLHASILWSPHAHAVIKSIDTSRAEAMTGVHAVLTHENVPRIAHTTAGQGFPEPSPYDTFILDRKVRFVGDRVAAVAAETKEIAQAAISEIKVEYEVLEPVFDALKALDEGSPVIHDEPEAKVVIPIEYDPSTNLVAKVEMSVGDVEGGLAAADLMQKARFETHYAQHTPIEPHVTLTMLDENGRLVIRTSTQVPFHVRRIVGQALDIPVRDIRVVKPRIGGGFGAKQEILLEDICSLLTVRTRKPVLLLYTRSEEFISSRTRHPMIVDLGMGMTSDGILSAISMDIVSNTGAYGSHGLTVVCNCGSKNLPLYRWKDIYFRGRAAYTNLPVGGAYRGYGATQAAFAMEVMVDDLAFAAGIDPLELRRKNHILSGQTSPVFRALGEGKAGVDQAIGSCGLAECIEQGAAAIEWHKRDEIKNSSRKPFLRGIGMACLMQGSSIPEIDMGAATLKMNEDGSFNLLVGATDLGTGSDTILAQIAGEVLGVDVDNFVVYSSDTDFTPFDVGAYASSTTYLSGAAVRKAAVEVKDKILNVASSMQGDDPDKLYCEAGCVHGPSGSLSFAEIAMRSLYQENQFQIAATASHTTSKSPPPFSAHFVLVEVDLETGLVKVLKYVAAVDCGVAINPVLAEGQTEGAVLNGISYALTEEYHFDNSGRMRNDAFMKYGIFSTRDMPEIETILIPTYEETGPFGAKSVSEISINGALPAISNAVFHATGARLRKSPFTPESVLEALSAG